jgi:hypothetical protein
MGFSCGRTGSFKVSQEVCPEQLPSIKLFGGRRVGRGHLDGKAMRIEAMINGSFLSGWLQSV